MIGLWCCGDWEQTEERLGRKSKLEERGEVQEREERRGREIKGLGENLALTG